MRPYGKLRGRKKHQARHRREHWLLAGFFVSILVVLVFAAWFSSRVKTQRAALPAGSDLRVPLAELEERGVRLFTYTIDSATHIQLAVGRGDDGQIRAAFASCRMCSRFIHREWSGKIVCGRCNHVMRIPDAGEQPRPKPDCVPVGLPYSIEESRVVVRGSAILDGYHRWFLPSGGEKE